MEKSKLKGMVFAALFAALTAAVAWFKIPLPFTPVPITLQTLMVLLSGAMLGPYYGALSMIIYLILGAIGLPVFAGGSSGVGALLGPTGGYLFSYPVAAFVIGYMLQKKRLNAFVRYFSFAVIFALVAIVASDSILQLGIIPFMANLSENARLLVAALSLISLLFFALLVIYAKKTKHISLDTVLAMFAGTLIIYLMGVLQAKFVVKPEPTWNILLIGWVLPFILGDTIKLILAAYIAKNADIKDYMK
ncbi:biotin transporter BioY [Candidatus Woesearchaeota archaeon]|nr:biotin transporter BioY [Candidatus Woesearchaeota archaeon]